MDNEILKTDTENEKNNTNSNNEVSSEKTENKKNAENDSVSSDNGEKKKSFLQLFNIRFCKMFRINNYCLVILKLIYYFKDQRILC